MPDPIIAALVAYLGKDGVNKLLGPTADYLGQGTRDFVKRRVENVGHILQNATRKLGDKIDEPGEVPPRVLRDVMNDGSYSNDPVSVEYLGGVLASSRSPTGRDDRGVRFAKLVDGMTTYQLRTHFLLYATVKHLCPFAEISHIENWQHLRVFITSGSYFSAMEFTQEEWNDGQILNHILAGFDADRLIDGRWRYGSMDVMQQDFAGATDSGFICAPSALGVELFLWAFGHGTEPLNYFLDPSFRPQIAGLPPHVVGVMPHYYAAP